MAEPNFVGTLQVGQEIDHERREWKIERIAWMVFLLIIIAGLAGLFGNGPLAHGTAGVENSALWVAYERLDRVQDDSKLDIFIGAQAIREGGVRLSLNRDYVEALDIQRVRPEPRSQTVVGDRVVYEFHAQAPDQGSLQPFQVTMDYEARDFGNVEAQVALEGGLTLTFTQFIYP